MRRAMSSILHRLLSVLSLVVFLLGAAAPGPAHARETDRARLARATTVHGQLNINTASVAQWDLLPGIGPATAEKIVAYRDRRPFRSLAHVMRVKGIGRKTFERIRPYLILSGETTLQRS